MDNITIRMASNEDIPGLQPLIEQLGYPASIRELEARFMAFTDGDGYGIAVACDDLKIAGWIAWSKSRLFVADKTRIHIEGLVVDKEYKRKGIGRKLMFYVEDTAKQYGPVIIDLTSGIRRAKDGAHQFYGNLGYQNEAYG